MGLMSLFSKPAPTLLRLPKGSFTVDSDGSVLAGTIPSNFPDQLVNQISLQVLAAFKEATEAHLPLAELIIHYPSLTITARELRGGALIFLAPQTPFAPTKSI